MSTEFWEDCSLLDLTDEQWESLCDGCGRCCLVRFESPKDGSILTTVASCRLLDTATCRCTNYAQRFKKVPGCMSIRHLETKNYSWLPETCAYRILDEGGDLPWWHPLVSGDADTVITAGVSVAGRVFNEDNIHPDEIETLVLRD
ncbi:MAG: putative cysteine cluster protein YcgN (CxxCxxCC family) [Parasphingorhabdus sp.]|jgi:uncharacterized cysteine cluster protein YcgN (CxxCxxCC family)